MTPHSPWEAAAEGLLISWPEQTLMAPQSTEKGPNSPWAGHKQGMDPFIVKLF